MNDKQHDTQARIDALTRRIETRAAELVREGIDPETAWVQAVMEDYPAMADNVPAASANAEAIAEMARRAYGIRIASGISIEDAWELAIDQMRKEGLIGN